MKPPECGPPDRRRTIILCGVLVAAVAIVFGQTMKYEFVNFDDREMVYENPHISQGLSARSLTWACTTSRSYMWCPVTWISFMLDYQLFGPRPWGFHLTNVLLHAATTVVLFYWLRQATAAVWASAWVAFVFAVHPLHVETVAWVAERKGLLAAFFCMLTLAAYVRYVRGPRPLAWYALLLCFFALGLMSKPNLVTLPLLLLVLDYWPLRRLPFSSLPDTHGRSARAGEKTSSVRAVLLEKVPLLLLTAVVCALTVWSEAGNMASLKNCSLWLRLANVAISCTAYLHQFFWPAQLAVYYPYPGAMPPTLEVVGAAAELVIISALAMWAWRRQPAFLAGWLWFVGMLLPVIGLIKIGHHARADRYTHLPYIGLSIAMAWGLAPRLTTSTARRRAVAAAATCFAALLALGAWQQTGVWRNSETLWTNTLASTGPNNAMAHYGLGFHYQELGDVKRAVAQYQEALQFDPNLSQVENILGTVLADHGRGDEALVHYRRALAINPRLVEAWYNWGQVNADRRQFDEAIAHYGAALRIEPDCVNAHNKLGVALAAQGRIDAAVDHYRAALDGDPQFTAAYYNLANALASRERFSEAIAQYEHALQLDPKHVRAHVNLGTALACVGRLDDAIAHFQKALNLKPDNPEARQNLEMALAQKRHAQPHP